MGNKIVIAYCRVSSAQMETSLDRQVEVLRAYCIDHGLDEPLVLSDQGISGFKDDRPGYRRLLELCKTGTVGVVLVTSLDRLSRSARSTIEFFETAIERQGIRFISLAQQVDSSSAQGKAFVAMAGVFSQLYRDEISAKVRAQVTFRRKNSLRLGGHVPFGYSLDADKVRLIVNQGQMDAVVFMNRMHASGSSYRQIARELERRGVRTALGLVTWHPKTVRALIERSKVADLAPCFVTESSSDAKDES